MVDEPAPERSNDPPDLEFEPVELPDDDEDVTDDTRHYLQDPNNLAQNARDADEQEQDDVLDVDQTELEELGLTLDDPHQPEAK